jgi:ADP-heptose:LPS heptosyltransferase
LPASFLPQHCQRILLVNPTRYLGNLLIAGGLIQDFAAWCKDRNISFKLVVDAAYAELLAPVLPPDSLIPYPRREIKQAGGWSKLLAYLRCLRQIRRFKADVAFNIEEDSVSHRLTLWSGAAFKLGCSTTRHGRGYDQVVPVNYAARPLDQQHRWYSFQQVFAALGLPPSQPGYLRLPAAPLAAGLQIRLAALGIDFSKQQVVLHAGAAKDYKKWPSRYFAELCKALRRADRQVVFIGAGKDADEVAAVLAQVLQPAAGIVNLCNQLSLAELAQYFLKVSAIVGNDSGPFHLAAAQGVAGLVIFGPTSVALWGPLSAKTSVLKSAELCSPQCTKQGCVHQHRCLTSITPQQVLEQLAPLLQYTRAAVAISDSAVPTTSHIS